MAVADLLTHRVTLIRRVAVLEGGMPILDEDGHAERTERRTAGVAAAIQPLSSRERAAQHQAGVTVSTHRIYTVDHAITSADVIEHDPVTCPQTPDLPAARYEVNATPDAAGLGHHLEIDATEIGPAIAPAPAAGSGGSGS